MTACNVFVTATEAVVWTDGAWIGRDGKVAEIRPKVVALPHLPAVIATQGGSWLADLFAFHYARRHATFDDMVAGASAFMLHPSDEMRAAIGAFGASPERLFLVGYSHAAGEMMAVWLQSHPTPEHPAWTVVRERRGAVSPCTPAIMSLLGEDHRIPSTFRALEMMELQRDLVADIGTGAVVRAVGGFALETVCTMDGITQRVARRWPDKIGEPIGMAGRKAGSARDPFATRTPDHPMAVSCHAWGGSNGLKPPMREPDRPMHRIEAGPVNVGDLR